MNPIADAAGREAREIFRGVWRRSYRGWLRDPFINSLDQSAELLYRRLHDVADDYGVFEAHPQQILCNVFPLQFKTITVKKIDKALATLKISKLVQLYAIDGIDLGLIVRFCEEQPRGRNGKRVHRLPTPSDWVTPDESGGIQGNPGASSAPQPQPDTPDRSPIPQTQPGANGNGDASHSGNGAGGNGAGPLVHAFGTLGDRAIKEMMIEPLGLSMPARELILNQRADISAKTLKFNLERIRDDAARGKVDSVDDRTRATVRMTGKNRLGSFQTTRPGDRFFFSRLVKFWIFENRVNS